ncbi:hypothetical protein B0H11DRAFT_1959668 [Mycena galericulata]|nr:hypothetical protein B0H11DRAFT_1959668 [Mycena galericulata]
MQAVYSTTTDVKIHQAIRREWASFQAWLFDQHRRLEHREHEILSAAQRRWGKMKTPDKQQIHGLQEEFLAAARSQWLARVRHSQLHLEHWVMTPDEKHMLQQTLGWTPKDMVDAYAREQAEMGPMYQRVDPSSLGKNEPIKSMGSPSRFMHPKIQEHIPAYANWAAELAKMPASALSPHRPSRSLKSVELPGMPLYFVGALLQGTDLDAVAASDLEAFAVHVSEEKIREYYSEACEASLHFQRSLLNLEPSQREAAQQDFEHHMRELASAKEREWKAITVKELRRHQALEMERRVMKQRAMRPPPRKATRRPPRRDFLHEDLTDWDLINSPQSSRRDYFEAYQSPPSEDFEAYSSPSPPRRRRAKRRPIPDEEYGEYAAARGWIRSLANNDLRLGGSRARTPGAARDWSAVRVDELDIEPRRSLHASKTRQPRNSNDNFILRLDGTKDKSIPAPREKLKKRRSQNKPPDPAVTQNAAKSGLPRMAGTAGTRRIFGRRVPDEEGKILEGKAIVGEGEEAKFQPDQFRHRLGRSGLGLDAQDLAMGDDGTKQRQSSFRQKEAEAAAKVSERRIALRQPDAVHAPKHVRFTTSAVASAGSVDSRLKRLAFRKLSESQSKFFEGFSRVNSAMS